MKTKFAILFLIACPLFMFGQMNSSIDFIVSVERSYRSLNLSSAESLPLDIISMRNSNESAKFNWRVGFNYNKRLTNKFYLKSGIRLASVGYEGEKKTDLRWPSEIGPEGYMFDPSLSHELQLVYDYWFLEIPLIGRYEFSNKKFAPFIEAGISPSYYLTTKTKSITEFATTTTSRRGGNIPYTNLHIVGVVSVGANYSINEKFQLFGQGTYRRHLSPLVDAPINEYLYNYGIEFGVRRKI